MRSSAGSSEPGTTNRAPSSIARAFSQQIIARAAGMAASLITVSLTTRELGPESYGHLQTAIMFVALWTSLTELGIGSVIVRRVTHSGADAHRLFRLNIGFSMVISVPLTAVAAFLGMITYHDSREVQLMLMIVSANLALTAISTAFDPIFMVHMRFGSVAASDFVGRFCSLAFTIVLILDDSPLYLFAVVQLVPQVVALVFKYLSARRLERTTPLFDTAETWSLVRESLPQTAVLIIGVLYWRIDGVMLSLLSTPAEVGLYGLAYTLAFTASMVPDLYLASTLSTSTGLFPTADSPHDQLKRFARFTSRTLEVMYFAALPLAVIGAILADGLIRFMGSVSFSEGSTVLALLCIAAGCAFINAAISQALFAAHRQHFLMRLNLINLAINIALNLVLIPAYGAIGAAIALIAAEVTGSVAVWIRFLFMGIQVQPTRFLLRSTLPLGASAAVAWFLADHPVVLSAPAALLTYLATHALVGPVRPKYLRALLNARDDIDEPRRSPVDLPTLHQAPERDSAQ